MEKRDKRRVLVLATSRKTEGGITTVVCAHEKCSFWTDYSSRWIATHTDGNFLTKFIYAFCGFVKCLFIMPHYDLIHIHLSEPKSALRKLPFFLLAKVYRKKIITHFHAFSPDTTINGNYKALYRFLFSKSNRVIVLSQIWRDLLYRYLQLKDNVSVIYNPSPDAKTVDEVERENIILYAGALNKRKGYEDLIRAFAMVANDFPEWKLVFAGSGDIENGKQLALQSGIYDRVVFLGWIRGEDKDRWFRRARIFCLPSYAEGFPMALLDACSYGIPFIVTPVGGIPDIVVNNQNGLLFTPGDIPALASCLQQLMGDVALREKLGKEALHLAQTTFSLAETDRLIRQIYSAV